MRGKISVKTKKTLEIKFYICYYVLRDYRQVWALPI